MQLCREATQQRSSSWLDATLILGVGVSSGPSPIFAEAERSCARFVTVLKVPKSDFFSLCGIARTPLLPCNSASAFPADRWVWLLTIRTAMREDWAALAATDRRPQ